jgi:dihydropteroate synthase
MEIAGILNVTEDSFSDGGKFINEEDYLKQIDYLIQSGADVIDIGAQSSNINAKLITDEEEWNRISPICKTLKSRNIKISIDTFKPNVIRKSILEGVNFINNINAFENEESMNILSEFSSVLPNLVLMFSHDKSGIARLGSTLNPVTVVDEISNYFDKKISELIKIGVPEDKLIFDPGMGFFLGDNPDLSIQVIAKISLLKQRFKRIYVSVSRKSFLGNILGGIPPLERNYATLAVEIYLFNNNIDWIRTHEPKAIYQSIKILNKIKKLEV